MQRQVLVHDVDLAAFALDNGTLVVLWVDGTMMMSEGKLVQNLSSKNTKVKWSALDKVCSNRFIAGGLNTTTDPYTQVIKLVDSSGAVMSSLSISLPWKVEDYTIASFQYIENLDLVVCRCSKRYLHLLALEGDSLAVAVANFDVSGDLSRVNHIVMTEDNKLLVGTSKGLAVVKLISN